MPTMSPRTTGNVTLLDPAPLGASPRTAGSVLLADPGETLPSARATGSVTLTVVEPISGPRVWSHDAQRWRRARIVRHEPGITWE